MNRSDSHGIMTNSFELLYFERQKLLLDGIQLSTNHAHSSQNVKELIPIYVPSHASVSHFEILGFLFILKSVEVVVLSATKSMHI